MEDKTEAIINGIEKYKKVYNFKHIYDLDFIEKLILNLKLDEKFGYSISSSFKSLIFSDLSDRISDNYDIEKVDYDKIETNKVKCTYTFQLSTLNNVYLSSDIDTYISFLNEMKRLDEELNSYGLHLCMDGVDRKMFIDIIESDEFIFDMTPKMVSDFINIDIIENYISLNFRSYSVGCDMESLSVYLKNMEDYHKHTNPKLEIDESRCVENELHFEWFLNDKCSENNMRYIKIPRGDDNSTVYKILSLQEFREFEIDEILNGAEI